MNRILCTLCLLLLSVACTTVSRSGGGVEQVAGWSAPPLDRAVSVRHGRTGEALSFDAFLAALARADVVVLGATPGPAPRRAKGVRGTQVEPRRPNARIVARRYGDPGTLLQENWIPDFDPDTERTNSPFIE